MTKENLIEGILKTLRNAQELCDESEILLKNDRFARSYSLSHLAREEFSKCFILYRSIVELILENQIDWKKTRRRYRSHKDKLIVDRANSLLLFGNDLEKQGIEMNLTLRDYQINGISNIINKLTEFKSVLFQMPTGTGKNTLFCEIVRKFTTELYPDKKVLIITHRKELVEQVFNRLITDFHLTAGIISSNYIGFQSSPIQVASIQTLVRREEHQKDIFSLVIIDEAHHALASTYRQLWDFYPASKFLGVTATPIRTNGQGFQDLFDKLITTAPIKWFIKNNYLSDVRYYASHTPDISNIKIRAGDYDETELSEVMQDKAVMADLVQSYIDFAHGKKMIVFAVNRAHSKKIVEKFNSSGFAAQAIDSLTPTKERREIVDDFRNNKFKILCNVNIFTEGFDCPDVDAVQLARPTKSLTLFIQQVGRCMRPFQNKEYGVILDNAGLWKEHGLPKMDRNWSLNGTDKNICPTQKEIIGIKENPTTIRDEPQESKAIRLIEVGELDNIILADTINFNNIDKNLIDKKIITMRERIEELTNEINDLEESICVETKEFKKKIFSNELSLRKKELIDLQEQLQPRRFDQVMDLIIEKCQIMIDTNEIFIEGDKDIFLSHFVEPYLKLNNLQSNNKFSNLEQKKPIAAQKTGTLTHLQSITQRYKNKKTKLKVTFSDSSTICEDIAIDTFARTMESFGIEKVMELGIRGNSLIISDQLYNNSLQRKYKKISDTIYYLRCDNNTITKKEYIEKIAKMLKVNIFVEIIYSA